MQSYSLESREKLREKHLAVVAKPKSQIYKKLAKMLSQGPLQTRFIAS